MFDNLKIKITKLQNQFKHRADCLLQFSALIYHIVSQFGSARSYCQTRYPLRHSTTVLVSDYTPFVCSSAVNRSASVPLNSWLIREHSVNISHQNNPQAALLYTIALNPELREIDPRPTRLFLLFLFARKTRTPTASRSCTRRRRSSFTASQLPSRVSSAAVIQPGAGGSLRRKFSRFTGTNTAQWHFD